MLTALERTLLIRQLWVLGIVLVGYALGSYVAAQWLVGAAVDGTSARLLQPALVSFVRTHGDTNELVEELEEIGLMPGESAALLDVEGRVKLWIGDAPRPERVALAPLTRAEGALRTLVVPIRLDGQVVGGLYIARQLGAEGAMLARFSYALLGMLPAALLVAGWAGRWLARRAAGPVRDAIDREIRFTRDVSHELRTPLAVIRLESQLARAEAVLAPEIDRRLAAIETTAKRMADLVDDMLAWARSEARGPQRKLTLSLTELIEEESVQLLALAELRGVTIRFDPGESDEVVLSEPGSLARIVHGLLDNAVRYTPTGGNIDVTLIREVGALVLTVASPGDSILAGERVRIFERFERGEAARITHPEGSGMGLAIARALAEGLGGTLALVPAQGSGNVFVLRLPV